MKRAFFYLQRRARSIRMARLLTLLDTLPRPISLLDVGGSSTFWIDTPLDNVALTVANIDPRYLSGANTVIMDARYLDFADNAFDVVFSNSVIEHVGTPDDQRKMAVEIRRVGKCYWVQTPNRYFPIEPHFRFPFWQFLPKRLRVELVTRFALGAYPRLSRARARVVVYERIRLLSGADMRRLFPDATLWRERLFGLTKSFVAYRFP